MTYHINFQFNLTARVLCLVKSVRTPHLGTRATPTPVALRGTSEDPFESNEEPPALVPAVLQSHTKSPHPPP